MTGTWVPHDCGAPRQLCIACVPLREKQALVLFKALFFWFFCPLKPVSILIFIALFSSFVFIYQPYQDLSHHLPVSLGIVSFIGLNSFQSRCNTHQEVAQCCIATSESVHRCAHCVQMLFSLSLCLCRGGSVCRADSKGKRRFSHGCSYSPEVGRTPGPAEGYQGALGVGWGVKLY